MGHMLSPLNGVFDLELGATEYGEKLHAIMGPRFGIWKHSYAHEIKACIGQQIWKRYFSFALVRNPISRTVSTFKYLKMHAHAYPEASDYSDINEFISSDYWKSVGPDRMFNPQFHWISDLRNLNDPTIIVDRVFKVEQMESVFPEIMNSLELKEEIRDSLKILNKNKSTEIKSDSLNLSSDSIECIFRRYKFDFSLFKYDI